MTKMMRRSFLQGIAVTAASIAASKKTSSASTPRDPSAAIQAAYEMTWCDINTQTKLLYVSKLYYASIHVIKTSASKLTFEQDLLLNDNVPDRVVVDSQNNKVYAGTPRENEVLVLGTSAGKLSVTARRLISTPGAIAVDNRNDRIFVSSNRDKLIAVINATTNTIVREIQISQVASAMAVHPVTGVVYVVHDVDPGLLTIISPRGDDFEVKSPISVAASPNGIALNPGADKYYVTHRTNPGTVSVLKLSDNSQVKSIVVGNYPISVVIDRTRTELYVANNGGSSVSVINGNLDRVETTIPVGLYPTGMSVDAGTKRLYVVCRGSKCVYMIDTANTKVVDTYGWGCR